MKSIVLILLAVSSNAVAQHNDWKEKELRGKVKSLTNQNIVLSKKPGAEAEWEKGAGTIYEFNKDGWLTEYRNTKADGSITFKTMYSYRSDNTVEAANFDKDLVPLSKTIFTVNSAGLKTEELDYTGEGKISARRTFEYDNRQHLLKKTQYRADGSVAVTYNWTYDSNGNAIKLKVERPGLPDSIKKYVYNDKGFLTEETSYDDRGNVDFRYERSYDDYGNKIQEIQYKRRDLSGSQHWKYQYDKAGNWIKRTHSSGGKNETRIEERTIVYY